MHKDPIQSLFIGSRLLQLPSCHSTNAVAADLLAESSTVEGTVIVTENQTAGKGQRGNSWESQPGKNLTLSIILKPGFLPIAKQFELTVISSLALTSALEDLGMPASKIKWPNDIYYNGSKIAGILIENTVRANRLEWSIIGIGLNVNQSSFETPMATSVKLELNKELKLKRVLQTLLLRLNGHYKCLKSGGYDELRSKYTDRLMWLNEQRTFQNNLLNKPFSGVIQGVSEEGKLIINLNNKREVFDSKALTFLH